MTANDILTQICAEQNITTKQLAELAGIPPTILYDITRGRTKKLKPTTAEKIHSVFPSYDILFLMTGNKHEGSIITGDIITADNGSTSYKVGGCATELTKAQERIAALEAQVADLLQIVKNLSSSR